MTTDERMQSLFRRESRSFLQYVREASPWASEDDRAMRDDVIAMADDELAGVGELAAYLQSRHIAVPHLGAFPIGFTSFNFVTIRSLVRPLLNDLRDGIARLTADADALGADERIALTPMIERKQKHLRVLEGLPCR